MVRPLGRNRGRSDGSVALECDHACNENTIAIAMTLAATTSIALYCDSASLVIQRGGPRGWPLARVRYVGSLRGAVD